jgi:hypothetical protein
MEKSHIRHYGAVIVLVVSMNAVLAWGQSNDAATADASLPVELIAALPNMSLGCSRFVSSEYRYKEDVDVQRLSTNGVMVVEDGRCLQCRGKCKAEDLRCRSQCAGEGVCLAHCEERSSKCEAMCKQIFQCE